MRRIPGLFLAIVLVFVSCAKERPFLAGHIRRVHDAALANCDPYNQGSIHTCMVLSSAFQESLYVYNATAGEMVLAPMSFFPLKIKVGSLTSELVAVVSKDEKFPFMFAIDHSEPVYYPIRLFRSADNRVDSFVEPKAHKLEKIPHSVAAMEAEGKILMLMTFPQESHVEIIALKKDTGEIDSSFVKQRIKVGTKPNKVVIDSAQKVAVISDEGEDSVSLLDLSKAGDIIAKGTQPSVTSLPVGAKTDLIYLSNRDLGAGKQLYALAFKERRGEIILINVTKKKVEDLLAFEDYLVAGYFPDDQSNSCCKGVKQWLSLMTIKGSLIYVGIKPSQTGLALEKTTSIDFTSEKNLAVSKVNVVKILGGRVRPDAGITREDSCRGNRSIFYVSSYAMTKSYLDLDPQETEGHAYSCEGEDAASRFGYKAK